MIKICQKKNIKNYYDYSSVMVMMIINSYTSNYTIKPQLKLYKHRNEQTREAAIRSRLRNFQFNIF